MFQKLRLPWWRNKPSLEYQLPVEWQSNTAMANLNQETNELIVKLGQSVEQQKEPQKAILLEQLWQLRRIERLLAQTPLALDEITVERNTVVPDVKEVIQETSQGQTSNLQPSNYVIDVMTLRYWQAYLLRGKPEHMHAVTGAQINGMYLLSRMIELKADKETWSGVTANPDSVFAALMELDRFGLGLYAIFHSHRMQGIQQPSVVDRRQMDALDAGGYPTIQGIVSEDGYWTFFSGKRPFVIDVIGKGVKQHDEHIFQLIDDGKGQHKSSIT